MSGRRIIDGLKDAVEGNFAAVTIDGQRWERRNRWQPIETAPKDGTLILICWVGGPYPIVSRWLKKSEQWTHPFSVKPNPPTHWMPLPSPPTA